MTENAVPVAVGPVGIVQVPFDSSGESIALNATDADSGDSHSFGLVDRPQHGTVQITGATATYTPDAGYSGDDSFSFDASDGIDRSQPATVQVAVASAPDKKPHASNVSATIAFGGHASITLQGSDPDQGDTLTYAITKQPRHGKVSGDAAVRTYTPTKGFAGSDSFTYRVTDSAGESASATVTVTVQKATSTVQAVVFSRSAPSTGQAVSVDVTLSSAGSVRGGTLTLTEGSAKHSASVTGSTTTVRLGKLTAGKHTFGVRFGGTSTTLPSSATTLPIHVHLVTSSLTVASKPKQITTTDHGVAIVHVSAPGATVDGGKVTVAEGSTNLGSAAVRDGVAKVTLPKLSLGQHNLVVTYAGTPSATSATEKWTVRVALG